ncbi:Mu transposase domain-containing protein [Thermohalobacter berrensis]|uniref:Transposase for insertion sequence element IS21-like C-terminal domain-containing protein n=1 Tax=Thermohalobacter berrensis TaxID=99594 RepID=A0A419T134_9FIRM|nr:hypothetical protein [Thermohalobacter berrensis]RKD31185.1 hypothetical protein BET03_03395 [Thermohalobacter berrensis]
MLFDFIILWFWAYVNYIGKKIFVSKTEKIPTEELLKLSLYFVIYVKDYLLAIKLDYDIARTKELRVNKYSVIDIEQNKYSVLEDLVGKFTFVKIYPEKIKVYYDNKLVATYKRSPEVFRRENK